MKFERTKVSGFNNAIYGMRNPMNSWNKSDSINGAILAEHFNCYKNEKYISIISSLKLSLDLATSVDAYEYFIFGESDMKLAQKLIRAGSEHRKFMRQIHVEVTISAPLFWWSEFDTYKVGTVANSTSTMHKIMASPFDIDMFETKTMTDEGTAFLRIVIDKLNILRDKYLQSKNKDIWKDVISLLPRNYIQKRTVTMTYENLLAMCSKGQRRFHKLTEWSNDFINWARTLPFAQQLIFLDELPIEEE